MCQGTSIGYTRCATPTALSGLMTAAVVSRGKTELELKSKVWQHSAQRRWNRGGERGCGTKAEWGGRCVVALLGVGLHG